MGSGGTSSTTRGVPRRSTPDIVRVFITGATGVLGRSAVRRFVEAGHDVTGVARGETKAAAVDRAGASPVDVDLFDADGLRNAVAGHEVVCHFASHIPRLTRGAMRWAWRENDRIWTEAARNLVDAAVAAGAGTYVHQSSGFMYTDGGDHWLSEDAPIDPPPHGLAVLEGEQQAHRFSAGGGNAVSLRFGLFYGPTAGTTHDFLRLARRTHVSVPGRPDSYYTSIHTEDLGTASVAALRAPTGAYNVVDDDPVTRREYADVVAQALGIKKLRVPPVPRLKRMDYLLRSQRVSNRRFRQATGWAPLFRSVREGWPALIAALPAAD